MKQILFTLLLLFIGKCYAQDYSTTITFPANYQVGDYVEFVGVNPIDAHASGYYEISISYTRNGIAAAATHLASISHSNPALWREVGRVNDNPYVDAGTRSFTIDCNTEYINPRFRVRAIATYGTALYPITVNILVHSINFNTSWTTLTNTGNDVTVNKFLPMTNEWSLYTGNCFTTQGANLAIAAVENGNVGIGTATPSEKLAVNGTIRSKEVKVEAGPWPDFVFKPAYKLPSLNSVNQYIAANGHLPGVPSEKEVASNGVSLGEMNRVLLKKMEELTLYIIQQEARIKNLEIQNSKKSQSSMK